MIRALAVAAALAAEALAVYTLGELIAAGNEDGTGTVPAVLMVVTALAAFGVLRLADWLDLSPRAAAALAGATAFVVIHGSLRIAFAGDVAIWRLGWMVDFLSDAEAVLRAGAHAILPAVLLIALWARSALRSNDEIELESLPRAIGIPFIAVTITVVLGATTDSAGEIARGGMVFYGVAVLALACSQLALSGATFGDLRAGGVTGALLGGTFALTAVCVVVFGLLFGVLRPILGPPLGAATEAILTVVLLPPAWIIEHVMRWLLRDGQLPELTANLADQAAEAGGEDAQRDPLAAREAGNFLLRIFALLVVLGGAALVVAWFSRLRKRVRARPEQAVPRAVAGSLREDLATLWRNPFRRREPAHGPAGATPAERLYLELLATAERAGEPRAPAETPEEFAPRLRAALHAPVSDEITVAFEQARYAGHPPEGALVAELERRWRAARGP